MRQRHLLRWSSSSEFVRSSIQVCSRMYLKCLAAIRSSLASKIRLAGATELLACLGFMV